MVGTRAVYSAGLHHLKLVWVPNNSPHCCTPLPRPPTWLPQAAGFTFFTAARVIFRGLGTDFPLPATPSPSYSLLLRRVTLLMYGSGYIKEFPFPYFPVSFTVNLLFLREGYRSYDYEFTHQSLFAWSTSSLRVGWSLSTVPPVLVL